MSFYGKNLRIENAKAERKILLRGRPRWGILDFLTLGAFYKCTNNEWKAEKDACDEQKSHACDASQMQNAFGPKKIFSFIPNFFGTCYQGCGYSVEQGETFISFIFQYDRKTRNRDEKKANFDLKIHPHYRECVDCIIYDESSEEPLQTTDQIQVRKCIRIEFFALKDFCIETCKPIFGLCFSDMAQVFFQVGSRVNVQDARVQCPEENRRNSVRAEIDSIELTIERDFLSGKFDDIQAGNKLPVAVLEEPNNNNMNMPNQNCYYVIEPVPLGDGGRTDFAHPTTTEKDPNGNTTINVQFNRDLDQMEEYPQEMKFKITKFRTTPINSTVVDRLYDC